jgi:hypothetical protein
MTQPRDRLPKEVMAEEQGKAEAYANPSLRRSLSGGRGRLSTAGRRVPTREAGSRPLSSQVMGFAVNNVLRIHN